MLGGATVSSQCLVCAPSSPTFVTNFMGVWTAALLNLLDNKRHISL